MYAWAVGRVTPPSFSQDSWDTKQKQQSTDKIDTARRQSCSTILKSNLRPALTFCGCTRSGRATVGYSGRCSYNSDNHYTQYTDLATRICDRA